MCDENARKVEHTVLIAMFDKYRAQVIARSCPILMKLIQILMRDPDQNLVRIPRRDLETRSRGEIPRRDPETRSRWSPPAQVLEYLSSNACCNFEAVVHTVQVWVWVWV